MHTLASSTDGLFSPAQMLLMLAIFSSVGLVVALILLLSKLFGGKAAAGAATSTASADADLERRRRVLEIDRMELENSERRQRLAREESMAVSKAA